MSKKSSQPKYVENTGINLVVVGDNIKITINNNN